MKYRERRKREREMLILSLTRICLVLVSAKHFPFQPYFLALSLFHGKTDRKKEEREGKKEREIER